MNKIPAFLRNIIILLFVLVLAGGAIKYLRGRNNNSGKNVTSTAKYVNFSGNYVFNVPSNYTVDEQSVPGAQLVYTGQITAKTLEDMYNAGGISLQHISDLTDTSSKAFKAYIDDKFVTDLKNNLQTSDVVVKNGKTNGQETAKITVKKDGQLQRFIFVKGGQHPAAMIAKQETGAFKSIEDSLIDIEKTDFKDEIEAIKAAIKTTGELLKAKNAAEIYNSAAPDLRVKSTLDELKTAMAAAAAYVEGDITISGISYNPPDIAGALRFTKLDKKDQQPAFGSLGYKKIDGAWKLVQLSLPTTAKP